MAHTTYFELDELLGNAERETGYRDWGEEDIRVPLGVLIDSINREVQFDGAGLERARLYLHSHLTARLRLINDRKRYPGVRQRSVQSPIFITGAQRTGTSYLNSLLMSDPGNVGIINWQVSAPSPPVNHPNLDHSLQVEAGSHRVSAGGWLEPYIRDKHDFSHLGSEEDSWVQEYSFVSSAFPVYWGVPSYGGYLATVDRGPGYRILKKFFQALLFGLAHKQLVSKSPLHISMLGDLFAVFPDARLIVNHRDPIKSLPSLMSLVAAIRRMFGCAFTVDRPFALLMMEGIASGFEDMIRRRQDPNVNRICVDVNYLELERSPIEQVQKIYDRFGMVMSDGVRQHMTQYIAENRKGKFGKHQYRLEDSGLTKDEVRSRFQFYTNHYKVPLEG
jgi:hypothetical protein